MRALPAILVVLLLLAAGATWLVYARRHRIARVVHRFPAGIVIHHTASPPVVNGRRIDVASIDAMHARRGFRAVDRDGTVYHIGYHFLVLQDGTVLRGRPEHLRGAHCKGHADTLGIALVGDFHRSSNRGRRGPLTPPPAQLRATEALVRSLMTRYDLRVADVYLHGDLGQTCCPGDHFPRAAFYRAVQRRP